MKLLKTGIRRYTPIKDHMNQKSEDSSCDPNITP